VIKHYAVPVNCDRYHSILILRRLSLMSQGYLDFCRTFRHLSISMN